MILSNQVECLKCGDKPFSANRHDFRPCTCGAISVDGGMDYLRRVGEDLSPTGYKDMSISMDDEFVKACREGIDEAIKSGRNSLGILCAVMRVLRDNDANIPMNITKKVDPSEKSSNE